MIDVTATMLPSTVINDRSLFVQIALSAMVTASRMRLRSLLRPRPPPPFASARSRI
jgi:hypothetical protein